jgi:hypothetical protein
MQEQIICDKGSPLMKMEEASIIDENDTILDAVGYFTIDHE